MPFVNQAQRTACWAQLKRDIAAGIKPKWDCPKWERESGNDPHSGFSSSFTDLTIRKGPRGGNFIVYKGYKVYIGANGFKTRFTMDLKDAKFTKTQCKQWIKNKRINPVTGRSISVGGPTYTKLVETCKAYRL